ncbi:paramyosin-like [Oncorhynchus clarkii lewisi]|uniref:paramyosin-like n=1 Tax=Oncorhynchus clarkii lewisi TaxID=490388 RepID=UPI0039B95091
MSRPNWVTTPGSRKLSSAPESIRAGSRKAWLCHTRAPSSRGLGGLGFCQWWKRYSGAAAVCLGLLCVLLLAGIIGLFLYCEFDIEGDQLQTSDNNLTAERDQLKTSGNNLTEERDQLKTSGNNLTEERDQVQTSGNTLSKEKDQLQTRFNTLTKEKDKLQTSNNALTKERDQLQTSNHTLTKERDKLKTIFNTLTKERDQLQTSNNALTKERDQLQKETKRLKQSLVEKVDSLILCCFSYRYWNSGEPNGGGAENCVYFYSWSSDTGEWTLKDVTLNRSPITSHRSNGQPAQTSETPSKTCKTPSGRACTERTHVKRTYT